MFGLFGSKKRKERRKSQKQSQSGFYELDQIAGSSAILYKVLVGLIMIGLIFIFIPNVIGKESGQGFMWTGFILISLSFLIMFILIFVSVKGKKNSAIKQYIANKMITEEEKQLLQTKDEYDSIKRLMTPNELAELEKYEKQALEGDDSGKIEKKNTKHKNDLN